MLLQRMLLFFVAFSIRFLLANSIIQDLNCSQIPAHVKQSCGRVSKTNCGGLGCCWNESEANSALRCFNTSNSSNNSSDNKATSNTNVTTTCSPYEGQVCLAAFSTTLPSFRLMRRLHRAEKNLVESYVAASITAINETVTQSECKAALTAMLCHHTLPPCHANNTVTRFCMSDCKEFFFKCGHFIDQLEIATNLIPGGKDFRLSFPGCFGLKNNSELEEAQGPCMKFGFNFSSPSEPPVAGDPATNENPVFPSSRLPPMRANCSTIISSERVGCVVPAGTNQTMCTLLGCCWDGAESDVKKRCYTKRGGTCMRYQGQACHVSFNSTLTSYSDTPRFFDNKFWLPATEEFLAFGIRVINQLVTDEKCKYIMVNLLCHYTVPPCYSDVTENIDYCRGDCEAIFNDCSAPLNRVIGAVTVHVAENGIDFIHTGLPNCSRHKTAQYYENKPGRTCIKTGFFNYTEAMVKTNKPTSPSDDKNLDIILPIVLVCVFIIVVIVIVFVLWQRRQKKRDAVDNGHALSHKGSMTVRDRLRAESLKSLDSRLLRLYDPDKLKQYRLDHVQYVRDLGEGFFGKVFQGRAAGLVDKQPKRVISVAVKALKEEPSKEQKDEFFREVTLMSILTHPNIVQLLAVSTEEEPYGMVFEYMSGGDLNQYLRNALPAETSLDSNEKAKVYLTQEDLVSISAQIATGMQYLAEMKFVHRDLAARNCLVGDDLVVKIADFGMSRDIYTTDYYKMSKETLLPIRWLAPEAFLYGKFTLKSDVYAYGVVLWEIFTFGLQPYYGYTNKEVMEFIQKGIHLGKPDNCPGFMYSLMKDCWQKEPEKRLEFTKISLRLKYPYHNYDVPPAYDVTEQAEESGDKEAAEPDTGNYDIPRSPATSDYDIPRAVSQEDGNYDVPRSSEDLRMSRADEFDYDVPNDIPV